MKEISGDFWKKSKDYQALVCTTNQIVTKDGRLVMGGGIALGFRETFKDLDLEWGNNYSKDRHLDGFMVAMREGKALVAMPTKIDWKNPSTIGLITHSADTLVTVTNIFGWDKVLMTRPGCGLGGLSWKDVKPVLAARLDDRFTIIEKSE